MKKVEITTLKTIQNEDLSKEYGICGLKAHLMMKVGEVIFGASLLCPVTMKVRE